MIKCYFGDIRNTIIEELEKAKSNLCVCVAWINDHRLMDILLNKAEKGRLVQIILVKDRSNLSNRFNYEKFKEHGGELFWDNHHHKFCIIDNKTVITGSYNWTYSANVRLGRENIVIIRKEPILINEYSREFRKLLKNSEKYNSNVYGLALEKQNLVALTLTEFFNESKKQGFEMLFPEDSDNPVHLSKAGNPQIAFEDEEGGRVYLRISSNLDEALRAGIAGIDLTKSPIYEVVITQGNAAGKSMLVIGLHSDFGNDIYFLSPSDDLYQLDIKIAPKGIFIKLVATN